MNWKEFKPTAFFIGKFLCLYLSVSLVYGIYVTTYHPKADPITETVTFQTSKCLSIMGWPTEVRPSERKPTTSIIYEDKAIVAVYEGCNGVNVMIIFISFMVSFGPIQKSLFWFIPLGVLIIHLSNLTRISLLFLVSLKSPDYLYFTHKYLFTAFIYGFVLLLWIWWVRNYSKKPTNA